MLKNELNVAKQAQHSLEEQKSANLVLKETIDRLRQDLEEIRKNNDSTSSPGSSAPNSLSAGAGGKIRKGKGIRMLSSLAAELGDKDVPEVMVEDEGERSSAHDSDNFEEETVITTRRKRVSHVSCVDEWACF